MDQRAHQEVQNKQLKEAQNKQDQPVQLNPQDTCESLWVAVEEMTEVTDLFHKVSVWVH